jgi:hypothetical protein
MGIISTGACDAEEREGDADGDEDGDGNGNDDGDGGEDDNRIDDGEGGEYSKEKEQSVFFLFFFLSFFFFFIYLFYFFCISRLHISHLYFFLRDVKIDYHLFSFQFFFQLLYVYTIKPFIIIFLF